MPLSNPSVTVSFSSNNSNTVTRSSVNASVASVILVAANAARKGVTIWNNSTANLYIEFGTSPTSGSGFAVKISPDGYYELPFNYTGAIFGYWDATNGLALVRELT